MKRTIYLFTIVVLTLTLTVSTMAHAKKKDPKPPKPHKGSTLPINTNIVYLVIAGLAIGVVAVKKAKQPEAGVR
jgi:hypothetical protein